MPVADITVQVEEVQRALDYIGNNFGHAFSTALEIVHKKFVTHFKKKRLRYAFKYGKKTKFMMMRSREFTRALKVENHRSAQAKDAYVQVGWFDQRNARIAAVNEFGTKGKGGELPDITPASKTYLAIPLEAALDAQGVPIHRSPWDWPHTFVRRSKRTGDLLIWQKLGRTARPLYKLQKKVSHPRRLFFRETYRQWMRSTGNKMVQKIVIKELSYRK